MEVVEARKQGPLATRNAPDLNIGNVKIINSTKTNIGTTVVCNEAVINQYVKLGDEVKRTDIQALKDALVNDTTNKFTWRSLINWKSIILTIFLAILVAGSTVLSMKLIKVAKEDDSDTYDDEDYSLPMNYSARLETRGMWAASERNIVVNDLLFKPANFVVVAHTGGPECYKQYNCENIVKGIQQYHLDLKYGDIGYNFLIGGDGYIYEGRGWGKTGSHTYGVNCASIGVAFIGDYDQLKPLQKSVDAYNLLVQEGVSKGEISPDYKLFSQHQILGWASPGQYIREAMKKWPHKAAVTKEDFICPITPE